MERKAEIQRDRHMQMERGEGAERDRDRQSERHWPRKMQRDTVCLKNKLRKFLTSTTFIVNSSQGVQTPFAPSRSPRKLGGRVLLSHWKQEGGRGGRSRCWGRSGPRWPWVAESHLPPVLLWCTFSKVKRIAESVAIDSDVSDSETKEAAQNFKALYPKLPKTQVPASLQDAEFTSSLHKTGSKVPDVQACSKGVKNCSTGHLIRGGN